MKIAVISKDNVLLETIFSLERTKMEGITNVMFGGFLKLRLTDVKTKKGCGNGKDTILFLDWLEQKKLSLFS